MFKEGSHSTLVGQFDFELIAALHWPVFVTPKVWQHDASWASFVGVPDDPDDDAMTHLTCCTKFEPTTASHTAYPLMSLSQRQFAYFSNSSFSMVFSSNPVGVKR
jgi:hypothetical protein